MKGTGQRTGAQPGNQQDTVLASATATAPRPARIDWDALKTAGRACCCPAKPAVIAVIPPASGRGHRTELLLCMHHYRQCRPALVAAGAAALDLSGRLIPPDTPAYLAAGQD
jgi:hypothetical protein